MFVLPRMVSGGVERVSLNLMRGLLSSGADCALALRRSHGELMEEAAALVDVREVAPTGMRQFVPGLATFVREWRPTHVVTAFADIGLLTHVAIRRAGSGASLIHGVHDSHGPEVARPGTAGRLLHMATNVMAGAVYRRASAIVTVSDGARDELLGRFPVDPDRVRTIYNPVVEAADLVARGVREREGAVRLIGVGRLARQKGFDVLLEAVSGLQASRQWKLEIFGEGPERPALEAQIARHDLAGKVSLAGYTRHAVEQMREADVFVLPSRHEGLPTVLIEALVSQAQIIATDCRHGPREILQSGRLGQLVPVGDPLSLRDALACAIDGRKTFDRDALRARAADFTVDASLAKWNRLLDETGRGAA